VKQFLSRNFDMKDMGEASYDIGIKIHRDKKSRHFGFVSRVKRLISIKFLRDLI
jgi:hypothetical protein